MKKVMLTLALTAGMAFASEATIGATMQLMKQGMEQIQNGFMYNNKDEIMMGINTLENSNAIFKNVDVKTFIPHNNKVQVTKNINENLEEDLETFKKAIEGKNYTEATKSYGQIMHDCVACHTIIRGW